MAKVQVGIIAYRDEKGNFLPKTKPIYRDFPNASAPHDGLHLGNIPLSERAERDVYKLFADKFREHQRALREAGVPSE